MVKQGYTDHDILISYKSSNGKINNIFVATIFNTDKEIKYQEVSEVSKEEAIKKIKKRIEGKK